MVSTRLSINVNDEVAAALRDLAERQDTTITEIVRRSVSVYYFFQEQRSAGKYVRLSGPDGHERVVLP